MSVSNSAAEFGIALDRIGKELTGELVVAAVQKISMDLFARIVMKTPIDTGRLRGNWTVSIDTADTNVLEVADKVGGGTIAAGAAVITSLQEPRVVWLQNNLPYAARIEGGWSKQAPAGMVAVSLAELEGFGISRL